MAKKKADANSDAKADSIANSPAPQPRAAVPEYTVVARRYRPQQFSDLIGQEHVASALTNALNSGRIAHAYLFTGARGTGKTSTARILAKALNCERGPTPKPCDACDICKSIALGEDVDVLEIDGASNNKVEEIRDLRSNVGFRPTRARYKIYIIDEVHMLSTSAFNALLKTLEEPPPHVKFIFATTEVHKIPITILSRCQRFDFAHVNARKIFDTLRHIVSKEALKADDEALQIIAKRAAGSMRDSQSLLDQLLAFSEGHLTAALVHQLFGTASDDRVIAIATAILSHDPRAAVELVTEAAERGQQLGELLDQLIDHWRGLMLVLTAGPEFRDLPGTPTYQQTLVEQTKSCQLDTILAGLDVLTTAKARLRSTTHIQVLLEMAVIRLSRLEELLTVGQLATAIANGAPITTTTSTKTTQVIDNSKKKLTAPNNDSSSSDEVLKDVNADSLPLMWSRLIEKLGPIRGSHLRQGASPAIIGPNSLAIRFPKSYSESHDHVANESTMEAIRLALKKITGQDWTVFVERSEKAAPLATVAESVTRPTPTVGMSQKDVAQLPLFKAIADVLGGQIVRMDDGFNPTPTAQ